MDGLLEGEHRCEGCLAPIWLDGLDDVLVRADGSLLCAECRAEMTACGVTAQQQSEFNFGRAHGKR